MSAREVLADFPASHPRGSWPAEEAAARLREQGQAVEVRMDLPSDRFIVVREGGERS